MNNCAPSTDSGLYHWNALVALGEADDALAFTSELDLKHPHKPEAVTPELLTETIAKGVANARVESISPVDQHDGMTSRGRWSVEWNATGRDAGLPGAIFAKATPAKYYHRKTIAILHMHEGESYFYRDLHPENPGLAPDVYYNGCYTGGRFLLILEDLIEKGCRPYWLADDCPVEHARAVAVAQANFHAKYWQSKRLTGDLSWARPRTRRFGWPWLAREFHEIRKNHLAQASEEELPENMRALFELWEANADAVFAYWDTLPATIIHGDSHLGNTYSKPDGTSGHYDWQLPIRGSGLRDLSYFLMSALNNEKRVAHERDIVSLYLETLADNGVKLDREAAWDEYSLYMFDRWDAVVTELMKGGYGHARSSMIRTIETLGGAIVDNDIVAKFEHLIRAKVRA